MASMRFKSNFNPASIQNRVRAAIGIYASTAAKQMEGEAKWGAPWTDRTTNARNSIQGDFGWRNDQAVISLSGNVDYFVYLELANEKKYAILKPTIDKHAPSIIKGYQRLVKR